jgi:hypothetical protein
MFGRGVDTVLHIALSAGLAGRRQVSDPGNGNISFYLTSSQNLGSRVFARVVNQDDSQPNFRSATTHYILETILQAR